MAGEGFIQHMISTLKNNKSLRKKTKFKNYNNELVEYSKIELDFKEVSEQELEIIKNRIRKRKKRASLFNTLILMSLVLVFSLGIGFLGYKEYKKEERYKLYLLEKNKKELFNKLIKTGDFNLGREKLDKTLKQYKRAKILYPNDSLVNSRISLVDSLIKVGYQPKIQ